MTGQEEYPTQMTAEELAARKSRNLIIALALAGFMVIVFVVTMVRMKDGVARDQDWSAAQSQSSTSGDIDAGTGAPPVKETGDE